MELHRSSRDPFGPDARTRPDGGVVFRRFGPNNGRFMFTMPPKGGAALIYRYRGEIAIPCGRVTDTLLWVDANGDGVETADERSSMSGRFQQRSFDVDDQGDIYALQAAVYDYAAGISILRRLRFQGVNQHGVPLYSSASGAYEAGLACGVELDPLYVDVIVRRYKNVTGQDAIFVETGATFDELAERRTSEALDRAQG